VADKRDHAGALAPVTVVLPSNYAAVATRRGAGPARRCHRVAAAPDSYYEAMSSQPVRHSFTVEDYYQMDAAGLFAPDQRLELLGGEIIEMAAIGCRHAATVDRLNWFFAHAVGERATVRVQNPVRLNDLSELQPDVTLLRWRGDFYRAKHPMPDDVLLMIEVSDTTVSWDRGTKRPYYAAAGITEMWIVDLTHDLVEVATNPGSNDYRDVRQVRPGAVVAPVALPDVTLAVADLFS